MQLGDHGKLLEQGTEMEVEAVQPPPKRATRQVIQASEYLKLVVAWSTSANEVVFVEALLDSLRISARQFPSPTKKLPLFGGLANESCR